MGRFSMTRGGVVIVGPVLLSGVIAGAASVIIQSADASISNPGDTLPVRPVRVLLAWGVERIRFQSSRGLAIEDNDGELLATCPADEWFVIARHAAKGVLLGRAVAVSDDVRVRPGDGNVVTVSVHRDGQWSPGTDYPGVFRVVRREDTRLDLINLVDVEPYVACVVASEVWPTFVTESLRGQAIASRTFVLYQMQRRNGAAYDVSATQGSQVYRGIRRDSIGNAAAEATAYTRGIVLTYREDGEDRLFCAYYSAACGGLSQSAAIFGKENDIPPLRGGVRCDECRIAPGDTYRWGPVRLPEETVRARLVAVFPKLASMGRISRISVVERTPAGRPVRLRVRGSGGESFELLAERFRLAIGGELIRSTDCRIRVIGGEVIFDHGRGFGHGLGLCQWGMQGRALKGWRAGAILRYYYPGANLTRVY